MRLNKFSPFVKKNSSLPSRRCSTKCPHICSNSSPKSLLHLMQHDSLGKRLLFASRGPFIRRRTSLKFWLLFIKAFSHCGAEARNDFPSAVGFCRAVANQGSALLTFWWTGWSANGHWDAVNSKAGTKSIDIVRSLDTASYLLFNTLWFLIAYMSARFDCELFRHVRRLYTNVLYLNFTKQYAPTILINLRIRKLVAVLK